MDVFEKGTPVRICAPMVRYSKLAFRNLVRLYDCDLAFSPMILADSFYQSQKARDNEFTTNEVLTFANLGVSGVKIIISGRQALDSSVRS